MYCMIAVNERCGILGGVVLLGLCCCRWGESGGVQVCAPRVCGVGETLEQAVLFVGIMSLRS